MKVYILESQECISDSYDIESIYAYQFYDVMRESKFRQFVKDNKYLYDLLKESLIDYAGFNVYRVTVKEI